MNMLQCYLLKYQHVNVNITSVLILLCSAWIFDYSLCAQLCQCDVFFMQDVGDVTKSALSYTLMWTFLKCNGSVIKQVQVCTHWEKSLVFGLSC